MMRFDLGKRLKAAFARPTPPAQEDPAAIDFRALMESSLDMICHVRISHGHFSFTYTSPATPEIFGWTCEELLTLSPAELFTEQARVIIAADIERIRSGHATSSVIVEALHKNGTHIWLENKIRVLEQRDDTIFVMVAMRDVTQQKRAQDDLAQQANFDALTRLHNRRAFDLTFGEEWRRAMRSGAPLSILLLDVDHFKLLNDNYGHQVGDDCLRAIASAIKGSVLRAGDFVARYGGEEFIVILPDTESGPAQLIANDILKSVSNLAIPHIANPEGGSVVTISCGVCTALGRRGGTIRMPEGLLLSADNALYKAKHLGRNRIEVSFLLTGAEQPELATQ